MTGYMRRSPLARQLARELDDAQAGRLLRAVTGTGGLCAHCPDCGEELQDEAFEFWCPDCQAAVSYARVTAEGA